MTQKTTLPGVFTGPATSTLPRFIPSLKVTTGLVRRYAGAQFGTAQIGGSVGDVPNLAGANFPLVQANVAKQPKLKQDGAIRYLEFDGADDEIYAAGATPGPVTVATVGRFRARPASGFWPITQLDTQGVAFSRAASGNMVAYSGSMLDLPVDPEASWHVFLFTLNGAASVARVDGNEVTGTTGNQTGGTKLGMGAGATGGFAAIDVAEVAVWNRALTEAERNAVVSALKANYAM